MEKEDEKFYLKLNEHLKDIDSMQIPKEEKDKLYDLVRETVERHNELNKNSEQTKKI